MNDLPRPARFVLFLVSMGALVVLFPALALTAVAFPLFGMFVVAVLWIGFGLEDHEDEPHD